MIYLKLNQYQQFFNVVMVLKIKIQYTWFSWLIVCVCAGISIRIFSAITVIGWVCHQDSAGLMYISAALKSPSSSHDRRWPVHTPSNFNVTTPQQTRYINPMLVQCWASVVDGGLTLDQHRVDRYNTFLSERENPNILNTIISAKKLMMLAKTCVICYGAAIFE